jgi:FtsX-like permease family
MFGSGDAVGRQIIVGDSASSRSRVTIIGVAQDTDVRRMLGEPAPFLYRPLSQHPGTFLTVVAHSSDSTSAVRALTNVFRRADADLPAEVIGSGRSVLAGPFEVARSAGQASIALGALTLVLATVGLYGIQSHVVGQRTREIGVRMSFGASARQIERMVLKDGYRPVVEGLALGLFIGLAGPRHRPGRSRARRADHRCMDRDPGAGAAATRSFLGVLPAGAPSGRR